ncbi:uncharacterized protein IUM83_02509 [Phytophthora cinnamomi]|uniref:uncharacterized protein n=1 Tax=Phytophthora cinnamomi TaxID=4785 RepID=UPI00355A7C7E|nr:hypothetical protein IUM83_02509 [Phytophthora cinnamomi]
MWDQDAGPIGKVISSRVAGWLQLAASQPAGGADNARAAALSALRRHYAVSTTSVSMASSACAVDVRREESRRSGHCVNGQRQLRWPHPSAQCVLKPSARLRGVRLAVRHRREPTSTEQRHRQLGAL